MRPLYNWDDARSILDEVMPKAETEIEKTIHWLRQYPAQNGNPEGLSTLLSQLNVCVLELGELQSQIERVKNWTDRRWEMEKGLEAVKIMRDKSAAYAKEAKYVPIDERNYLQAVVDSSAMHLRLQNARSSARDTTEAIRSRISQIKGAIRSS